LGLVLIVKGGDYFVDAASWIAEVSGVPKFVILSTIVSIATTLPEVIVSLVAALQHETEMAVGNAVGSVTANIGLITGILFVCMPFAVERKQFFVKSLLMIASCAALLLFSFGGELGAAGTAVLFIIFAVFVTENIISARRESQKEGAKKASSKAKKNDGNINDIRADNIADGKPRLLFNNGSYGCNKLRQGGSHSYHRQPDHALIHTEHLRDFRSVIHQQTRADHDPRRAENELDNILRSLPSYIGTVLDQTALG